MFKTIGLIALGLGAAAAADRPDLNGVWQLSNSAGAESKFKSETLTIHQGDDTVQITEDRTARNGKEMKDDIQCNTSGQECKLKTERVSLYYNGQRLVMLETQRDIVTKKRFTTSEDGKTLNLEVIHIAPGAQRTETFTYTKQTS